MTPRSRPRRWTHLPKATLIAAMIGLAAPAAPVAAAPSDAGSCVASFVQPQAEGSGRSVPFGETVRLFTVVFYPLGQTVSFQADSERDACPFQAPD